MLIYPSREPRRDERQLAHPDTHLDLGRKPWHYLALRGQFRTSSDITACKDRAKCRRRQTLVQQATETPSLADVVHSAPRTQYSHTYYREVMDAFLYLVADIPSQNPIAAFTLEVSDFFIDKNISRFLGVHSGCHHYTPFGGYYPCHSW